MEIEEEINNSGFYNFPSEEARQKFIDDKTYQYVKQNIQSFVFNLNIPSRWGTQTPFTNITLDLIPPEDLKNQKLKLGGNISLTLSASFRKKWICSTRLMWK